MLRGALEREQTISEAVPDVVQEAMAAMEEALMVLPEMTSEARAMQEVISEQAQHIEAITATARDWNTRFKNRKDKVRVYCTSALRIQPRSRK